MLEIRNLRKELPDGGGILLQGINMEFQRGELVVILGASGSGKTTLLKCIGLRDKWTEGKLYFHSQDIFEMGWQGKRRIHQNIALIEEQPNLNLGATAHKNVLAGSRKKRPLLRFITGTVSNVEYSDAMEILHTVGLSRKVHVPAGKLSGGEKQRVAIARALAQGAEVIVADEPISGVDPHTAQDILADIKKLCENERLIFICTLNNVEWAEQYASRIIGLADHRVAFDIKGRRLTTQEKLQVQ
jgi:phosphonate transport system ATP-binding protein